MRPGAEPSNWRKERTTRLRASERSLPNSETRSLSGRSASARCARRLGRSSGVRSRCCSRVKLWNKPWGLPGITKAARKNRLDANRVDSKNRAALADAAARAVRTITQALWDVGIAPSSATPATPETAFAALVTGCSAAHVFAPDAPPLSRAASEELCEQANAARPSARSKTRCTRYRGSPTSK